MANVFIDCKIKCQIIITLQATLEKNLECFKVMKATLIATSVMDSSKLIKNKANTRTLDFIFECANPRNHTLSLHTDFTVLTLQTNNAMVTMYFVTLRVDNEVRV